MWQLRKRTAALLAAALIVSQAPFGVHHAHAADEVIYFPDGNLKKALIAKGVDLNNDGEITRQEMEHRADPLNMATGLATLELTNAGITDLTGIEYAVNLKSLNIGRNPVSNLGPLASMTNLETLALNSTNVTDLNPVAGLSKLRLLDLSNTPVRDLRPIASLTGLSALLISRSGVSDISPIANLGYLSSLFAEANNIRDIGALASLPYLRHVSLEDNQVADISPLANAASLERLYLDGNRVTNLDALSRMTRLQELGLSDNQISSVAPLSNLTALRILSLDVNQLADISPLSRLVNLEYLGLYGNSIRDVAPLANMVKLQALELGQNRIDRIDALSRLSGITSLSLGGNQISDIGALSNMTGMRELSLGDNRIVDIGPLRRMTGMYDLRLQNNQISDISPLTGMSRLAVLYLTGNPIKDASPLKELPSLINLHIEQHYRDAVRPSAIGVVPGGQYNRDVTIRFEKGTALLNGSPITSGTVVSKEGKYTLELRESLSIVSTIHFIIDRTPPKVTGVTPGGKYNEPVTILFNEGEATLNGKPVNASFWVDQFDGSDNYRIRIEESGSHTLVVTDAAGNSTTIRFDIQTAAANMIIRGVSDRGVYHSERSITFSDATATLNGRPFQSGGKVSEAGEYTLEVRGKNGASATLRFTIRKDGVPGPSALKGVSSWAMADMAYAQGIGLTSPVVKLDFTSLITREQFSEVAVKLHEALTGSATERSVDNPFTDTDNPEIVKAYQLGIVTGTAKDRFSPHALITREQLAAMLMRVLTQARVTLPAGEAVTFRDRSQFSPYAVEAIGYLSSIEVIKGINEHSFGPKQNASIEQAVVMAKRIHEMASQSAGGGAAATSGEPFGSGDMFAMYVSEVRTYPGVEGSTNEYALTNERAFVLPAHSAVYLIAPINQQAAEDNSNGELVVANTSDRPKTIREGEVDMSLLQWYRDVWGTVTSPDGVTRDASSTGPFLRLVVFDGPFDEDKPYFDYIVEGHVLDLGNWFTVRHR